MAINTGSFAPWKLEQVRLDEMNREYAERISELYVENFRKYLMDRAAEATEEAAAQLKEQMRCRVEASYDLSRGEQMFNVEISFKGKPDVSI